MPAYPTSRLSDVAKIAKADTRMTKSENDLLGNTSGSAASKASRARAISASRPMDGLRMLLEFLPEQAGRFGNQDYGHQQEHQPLGEQWKPDRTKTAHQPDQQRADQRAGNRAHATDDRHDE